MANLQRNPEATPEPYTPLDFMVWNEPPPKMAVRTSAKAAKTKPASIDEAKANERAIAMLREITAGFHGKVTQSSKPISPTTK